jgi:hypothetical protein
MVVGRKSGTVGSRQTGGTPQGRLGENRRPIKDGVGRAFVGIEKDDPTSFETPLPRLASLSHLASTAICDNFLLYLDR